MESCTNCRFRKYKECRKNAPTVKVIKPTRIDYMRSSSGYIPDRNLAVWPEIQGSYWCGEWRRED
jgi:hypothetical protein